ncbi:hypothetical protein QSV34_07690 [Porticoccus sp. W117]|uniref:hypothetical protein n=1 Tax=Porticoccus sp. W117 TaxID=3054777 RepID=UPI002597CC73|nr:hypothetical protein [Porticoccus sp. W117]MDM3871236.1 hypothetical protein [Porticoccus sp. W117]
MKFFIILLISLSPVLYADDSLAPQTIKKVSTGWANEGVYIELSQTNNADGCQASRVKFDAAHPFLKEILSIALSAFHAKSNVQIRVSGCTGIDFNGIAIEISE